MKLFKYLLLGAALLAAPQQANAQRFLPGAWTLAPGVDNIDDNLPANTECMSMGWVLDGPGGNSYVYSDCTEWKLLATSGPEGPQGPKGDKGDTGDIGPQGVVGANGADGAVGAQGPKGDTGDIGPQGIQGETGPAGPKGDKGDAGAQGLAGADGRDGADGAQGIQGVAGSKGDTGLTGETGLKGDTGPKGDTGESGLQGVQGAQGVQGVQGPAGPSKRIVTALATTDANGNATITFDPPFSAPPHVTLSLQTSNTRQFARITSVGLDFVTINAYSQNATLLSLLGLDILTAGTTPITSSTVRVMATEM